VIRPAIERALPRLDVGVCWLWPGALDTSGYGCIKGDDGRTRTVHRLVYESLVGPVPPGMYLDHLCRVRHCANPDHLEPVTPSENRRRGNWDSCKRGHLLDRFTGGQRTCSRCARDRSLRHRQRQT
jgi:hypothetical protein